MKAASHYQLENLFRQFMAQFARKLNSRIDFSTHKLEESFFTFSKPKLYFWKVELFTIISEDYSIKALDLFLFQVLF